MRCFLLAIVCMAWVTVGCNSGTSPLPTAPSAPNTGTSAPPTPPPPTPRQPTDGVPIAVGEVVSSRVTLEDPLCDPAWPHHCAYYRLIAPGDGEIEFVMTCPALADAYVVDIGVIDPAGRMWISKEAEQFRLGPQRSVNLRVTAGATYVIEIWSLDAPGEVFELKTSFRP